MRILVTTDGSRRSLRALPHAAHFANATDAELLVLRVLDPRIDCAGDRSPTLALATRRVGERWLVDLEARAATLGVPATAHVTAKGRRDDISRVILRFADDNNVRMIAMATRGAGVVRRALLGSVATGVLGRSECPVMMVGARAHAPDGRLPYHLLITTDGSEAAATVLPVVRRVLERAPRENVRLTLLRVHQPAFGDPPDVLELQRRQLSAFRRRAPRRFPVDVELREDRRLGGAQRGILDAAGDCHVSAIWMATHGHSFRRQVLLGSVALSTVRQSTVPVILTRAIP